MPGPTLPEPSMPNRHTRAERPFATETHHTMNYWKGFICLFLWWSKLTLSKAGFFMFWRPSMGPPCNFWAKSQRTKPTWLLEYLNKANFWSKSHQNRPTHIFNLWNTFSDNDSWVLRTSIVEISMVERSYESRYQCVTNLAENSTSQLRMNSLSSPKRRTQIKT